MKASNQWTSQEIAILAEKLNFAKSVYCPHSGYSMSNSVIGPEGVIPSHSGTWQEVDGCLYHNDTRFDPNSLMDINGSCFEVFPWEIEPDLERDDQLQNTSKYVELH
jgi:hypothetical protein